MGKILKKKEKLWSTTKLLARRSGVNLCIADKPELFFRNKC